MMRTLFTLVLGLAGLLKAQSGASVPAQEAPQFTHLYFFDVSGSMYERLGPPGSAPREALAQTLFRPSPLFRPGHAMRVYQFTLRPEPAPGLSGPFRSDALGDFVRSRMAITRSDTDLVAVLDTAERDAAGKVSLVWILTDNVNDPRGSGGDVQNTQSFYARMFRAQSSVQRVYFFPIPERKLVLYLLVLSSDPGLGGLDLDQFENALTTYAARFRAPKIRAKPVGGEMPLEIDPRINSDAAEGEVPAEMVGSGRHGVLIVRGMKEGVPLRGTFRMRLRSKFDEWRIEQAEVERTALDRLESDQFPNISGGTSARLTPSSVSVDPRSTTGITYTLDLGGADPGLIPKAPFFTASALSPDARGRVRGRLSLSIGNPKLRLKLLNNPALTQAVQQVFHLEDIEYFVPKSMAAQALRLDFSVPVEFEVGYRSGPRWAVVVVILLALVGAGAFFMTRSSKAVYVKVEGYSDAPAKVSGRKEYAIAPHGLALARILLNWKGGLSCQPVGKAKVNGGYRAVPLRSGDWIQIQQDEAQFRYRVEIVSSPKAPPAGGSPGSYY